MVALLLISCISEDKISVIEEDIDSVEDTPEEISEEEDDEEVLRCGILERADESTFIPQGGYVIEERRFCFQNWHAGAGAKNSMVSVTLDDWQGATGAKLRIVSLLEEVIVDWRELEVGASVFVELEQSGEFFIEVAPVDINEESNNYQLSTDCIAGCDLEYTRYPIVFFHGLAGFDSLLNVMDYWIGVEPLLSQAGYHVEIHGVSAFDTTVVRTGMWKDIIDQLLAEGVGRKFNFIGHSQGGLDARYITSVLDEQGIVESITTIATPHYGSSVADALTGAIEVTPFDGAFIDATFNIGSQLFGTTGEAFTEQLEQMTTENMLQFNIDVPDVDGVQYYSWAGQTCRYTQFSCQNEMQGETVSSYFLLAHAYMEDREGENDGLVSVISSQWGEFLGILPADHMDEVGHRFDLSTQPFDAAEFYLSEAQRLSVAGH